MTEQDKLKISQNVDRIRAEMVEACKRAGRDPKEVKLCAASKVRDVETVSYAATLPIDIFGENRVQEFVQKRDAGAYRDTPYHFIGHLQTNKVKQVVGCALIHSVDSSKLLQKVNSEAEKIGIVQNILIEVNIGGEESKSGCNPADLWGLLEEAGSCKNLHVKGLMTIPPVADSPEEARPYFAKMRALFDEAAGKNLPNVEMEILSMGMSGDFATAIEEGATVVRVGTAIFGARPPWHPAAEAAKPKE